MGFFKNPFENFDPIGDIQRAGRSIDRAIDDTGRAIEQGARTVLEPAIAIGAVQVVEEQSGFQQAPPLEFARVPTLDDLRTSPDPPGNLPIPKSSGSTVSQRAVVFKEAAINAELVALFKAKEVLQTIDFHSGTSEHSFATLQPFQILIPREINASSRNSIFCLLRIESCSVEFDGSRLILDGWQFAFECHLEGLSIVSGDYSVERLFSVLLDNISTDFDSAYTSVGLNASNEPISWSSWLKDPQSKNKQYEIPLRSFIERWVKKNIATKEFNKFGFKFELSEYSPSTEADKYNMHVRVFSPSTELGLKTDEPNALLYYEILANEASPSGLNDDFRKSLAGQLVKKSAECGIFGITGSSPVNQILQILAAFSRKINFNLRGSSPPEITVGNSADARLYVEKNNQEQTYIFQQTLKSPVPEERIRSGFLRGNLVAKFELKAVFSESGSRLRLFGASPILYAMYFGQDANFQNYNQGIHVENGTDIYMEFSLKPSPTLLQYRCDPVGENRLLPNRLGGTWDEWYFNQFTTELLGEEEFGRRVAFIGKAFGDISEEAARFPEEFKSKFNAPTEVPTSKWFSTEQMITTDLKADDDGNYIGLINALRLRVSIKITTILGTSGEPRGPQTTATTPAPSTTSGGGPTTVPPATNPTSVPTIDTLTAQGKLNWELTSTAPMNSNQDNKLTLVSRNTTTSSLRIGYLKVKFTAGDEFSDLFLSQPIIADASSTSTESGTAILVSSSPQIAFSQPRLEANSSSSDGNWWTLTISPKAGEKSLVFPGDAALSFSFEGKLGSEGNHSMPIIENIVSEKGDTVYKSEGLQVSFGIGEVSV